MSILDLDQLKSAGLDPAQLAADVARLMGYGDTCEGPLFPAKHALAGYCEGCGARDVYGTHKRIPLPVDAVRPELLMWLRNQSTATHFYWWKKGLVELREMTKHRQGRERWIEVSFTDLTDESTALGVAAVELFKERR